MFELVSVIISQRWRISLEHIPGIRITRMDSGYNQQRSIRKLLTNFKIKIRYTLGTQMISKGLLIFQILHLLVYTADKFINT